MRRRSAEAILLEVSELQERDRIVTFVTAEFGRKRGVAPGARRKYSRFAGQLQPLARVRLDWFEKDDRELVRIGEVTLVRPAHRLYGQLEDLLLGAYLAEHVTVFAQEDEASGPLFRLLDTTILALQAGTDRALAARYFETWVLRLAGIFPAPRECPLCASAFDQGGAVLPLSGEALICRQCAQGHEGLIVDDPTLAFLRESQSRPLEAMAGLATPAAVLGRVERVCAEVRRAFLGRELRSYEVMRRTVAEVG